MWIISLFVVLRCEASPGTHLDLSSKALSGWMRVSVPVIPALYQGVQWCSKSASGTFRYLFWIHLAVFRVTVLLEVQTMTLLIWILFRFFSGPLSFSMVFTKLPVAASASAVEKKIPGNHPAAWFSSRCKVWHSGWRAEFWFSQSIETEELATLTFTWRAAEVVVLPAGSPS